MRRLDDLCEFKDCLYWGDRWNGFPAFRNDFAVFLAGHSSFALSELFLRFVDLSHLSQCQRSLKSYGYHPAPLKPFSDSIFKTILKTILNDILSNVRNSQIALSKLFLSVSPQSSGLVSVQFKSAFHARMIFVLLRGQARGPRRALDVRLLLAQANCVWDISTCLTMMRLK